MFLDDETDVHYGDGFPLEGATVTVILFSVHWRMLYIHYGLFDIFLEGDDPLKGKKSK